jgi:hypothetical protein
MEPATPLPDQTTPAAAAPVAYKVDRRRAGWNARCTICSHPNRAQIELALARGASRRSVGAQYDCAPDAARRHFENHVADDLKTALLAKYLKPSATIEAILAEESPGLLERLAAYRAGAWHLFNLQIELGNPMGIAPIMRELVRVEELIATQTGELRARANAPVQHLHLTTDFIKLRQAIMIALKPFPAAMGAVSEALRAADAVVTRAPVLIDARAAE